MFAKNPKNGRSKGQTRSVCKDRPLTMPNVVRSHRDGQTAAASRAATAVAQRSKRPTGQNRTNSASAIKRPVNNQYADVKSRYGTGILWRGPLGTANRVVGEGFTRVQVDRTVGNEAKPRKASSLTKGLRGQEFEEVALEENLDAPVDISMNFEGGFPNVGVESARNSLAEMDSVLVAGIARVQHCQSPAEVVATFASIYRELLDRSSYVPATANASTQTAVPRLRRSQRVFDYVGPWESCTHRQGRDIQIGEQNLQPRNGLCVENSNRTRQNWAMKLFDWKSFVLLFVFSAILLGLSEILKAF